MARKTSPDRRSAYVLPRGGTEPARLDVQHYAICEAIGTHFLAPIGEPDRVLDVGSGTGQWAYDIAGLYGHAQVVGLDLVEQQTELHRPPSNFVFVRGNALQGLPFEDATFGFVHQRLLVSGVPVREWASLMSELVRVTRPGGWVEVLEAEAGLEPEGPATRRLYDLARQLGRSAGLDTLGYVTGSLDRYLADAGLESVQTRSVRLRIGEWAGRAGFLMACDYRALFSGLSDIFAGYGMAREELQELVGTMLEEFEEYRPTLGLTLAFGRRS